MQRSAYFSRNKNPRQKSKKLKRPTKMNLQYIVKELEKKGISKISANSPIIMLPAAYRPPPHDRGITRLVPSLVFPSCPGSFITALVVSFVFPCTTAVDGGCSRR